jgi:hypothetical protein
LIGLGNCIKITEKSYTITDQKAFMVFDKPEYIFAMMKRGWCNDYEQLSARNSEGTNTHGLTPLPHTMLYSPENKDINDKTHE